MKIGTNHGVENFFKIMVYYAKFLYLNRFRPEAQPGEVNKGHTPQLQCLLRSGGGKEFVVQRGKPKQITRL